MGLFGKKNGNGQSGRQAPEYAEVSGIIAGRLSSERDETVLIGIGDLMRGEAMGKKYRPSEVIDKLAEVLQFPHGDEVVEKAGDSLIEKLKNGVHFEDAALIITNRLGMKTGANAKFFVKMLDRLEYKPDLRKLAVEMLAGFRGVELGQGAVDNIEMALLQRLMDPKEHEGVKETIKKRFGKEGKGRPQIKVDERRGDETVAVEDVGGAGPAKAKMNAARDIPTESMDVVAGFLMQLKEGDPLQKERAAKALEILVGNSKSRSQIERIREEVAPMRMNFPDLYRKILLGMQKMLPQRDSVRPPIAVGPGNGNGAVDRNTPTLPPLKR